MCLKILKIQVNQVNRNLAAHNGDVINKDKPTITTMAGETATAIMSIALTVATDLMSPTIVEAIAIVKAPAKELSAPV
jgi:type VI protein secretion system component Hcp